MNRIAHFLASPAHWAGLLLATAGLVLAALGLTPASSWLLVPAGYVAGYLIVGLRYGYPHRARTAWAALTFDDQLTSHEALNKALAAQRELVETNPHGLFSDGLQSRLLALCDQLAVFLQQWERNQAALAPEDRYHARLIIQRYLPDALRAYLSIPANFARSRQLANGQTAEDTLRATVEDLSAKVLQLTEDLALQDAEAFLNHSRFLQEKFGARSNPLQGIRHDTTP